MATNERKRCFLDKLPPQSEIIPNLEVSDESLAALHKKTEDQRVHTFAYINDVEYVLY